MSDQQGAAPAEQGPVIYKGLAGVPVDYTAVSKVNPETNSLQAKERGLAREPPDALVGSRSSAFPFRGRRPTLWQRWRSSGACSWSPDC